MKVSDINSKLGLNSLTGDKGANNDVMCVYCGDLLSWVMSHVQSHSAWITIQGHINTIAVAILAGVSCIILVDGAVPDDDMVKKAKDEDITIFTTDKSAFEIAKELGNLGL